MAQCYPDSFDGIFWRRGERRTCSSNSLSLPPNYVARENPSEIQARSRTYQNRRQAKLQTRAIFVKQSSLFSGLVGLMLGQEPEAARRDTVAIEEEFDEDLVRGGNRTEADKDLLAVTGSMARTPVLPK